MKLSEHAYALKEVFTYLNYQYDYNWVSPSLAPYHMEEDWLNLSAGVIEVKIVTNLHEEMWCGTVLEFEKTRSLGWSRLVESLTRFNFAWGAMERYIKNDNFKFERERSINGAKKLLCEQNWSGNPFEQYDENVKKLYSLMKQFMLDEIPGDYDEQKFYSRGISLINKIRNVFAHGSRALSDSYNPQESNDDLFADIEILNLSTSIIYYTLQFLLLVRYKSCYHKIHFSDFYILSMSLRQSKEKYVDLEQLLKTLHIKIRNGK